MDATLHSAEQKGSLAHSLCLVTGASLRRNFDCLALSFYILGLIRCVIHRLTIILCSLVCYFLYVEFEYYY
jgi:hypothetical protein